MHTLKAAPQNLLVFRCDASETIGFGHVMRCLALAETWHRHGGSATIIGQIDNPKLQARMDRAGLTHIQVGYKAERAIELAHSRNLLLSTCGAPPQQNQHPWFVMDGYHFDVYYQTAVREQGYRLCVIDDIAHLDEYNTDILLNQNIGSQHLAYPLHSGIRLCGPRYVMLRSEFTGWHGIERPRAAGMHKILVTFGGTDMKGEIPKALRALSTITDQRFQVWVVLGYSHVANQDFTQALQAVQPVHDVELLKGVEDMSTLMAEADLAICAAGSTTYELAFMGVPMILLAIADNQLGVAQGIHEQGAGIYLGWHEDVSASLLAETVVELAGDPVRRNHMQALGRQLIDGDGCVRILQHFIDFNVNVS